MMVKLLANCTASDIVKVCCKVNDVSVSLVNTNNELAPGDDTNAFVADNATFVPNKFPDVCDPE
jgi:hypothetical protein